MNLMAAASDLLMAYLSLEMVSLISYIVVGFRRRSAASAEAALKYVIYGGVASGVMLFGLSLLYGLAGATDFATVRAALVAAGPDSAGGAGAGRDLRAGRLRLQGGLGALPHVVPRRLRGRAHPGHRLPLGGPQGGGLRACCSASSPAPGRCACPTTPSCWASPGWCCWVSSPRPP